MCSTLPTAALLPSIKIVSTRIINYYSVCVDLSSARAVHALEHCPCITDPKFGFNGADCGAVHYGLCSPLILPPAVDFQKLQTLTPIVAKVESYRDQIQAAIELLAVEEEPADLETLLRNFVLEDRRRQESKLISANELDSKGKIIRIKSQPQIDIINNIRNDESPTTNVFGVRLPTDKDRIQSLVQSRLSKFDSEKSTSSAPQSHSSSLSSTPPSEPSVEPLSSSSSSQSEKLVFGISPKSTSLSRYKSIIELRKTPSPQPLENDEHKDNTKDATPKRTIIVKHTPVCQSPKIGPLSAPSQPFASVPESATLASAPTFSVIDSKCVRTTLEPTSSSVSVTTNASQSRNTNQMSPSPVKTVSSSVSSSPTTTSTKVQLSSQTNNDSKQRNGRSRPLSAPESSMEEFIVHQLTDDEKAILQRSSRKITKDDQHVSNGKNSNNIRVNGNSSKPKPANDKPKPRIITLSRPLPKPEPKPVEPKFVNGKLVFGQIPVKPYLAKGSVAERVLLFEKCPEKTSVTKVKDSNKSIKMPSNKLNQWMRLSDNKPNELTRRFSRSNSLTGGCPAGQIPKFYYPLGRPYSSHEVETQIRRITSVFDRFPARIAGRKEFAGILKIVGLPLYWKEPVFRAVYANNNNINNGNGNVNGNGNGKKEIITCDAFVDYWKKVISSCYDNASRFVKILTGGQRNYLLPDDFGPMIQDVIETHPGLAFLKEAEEFHSRYVHTVIARIYYCVNKSWSGRITLPELKKSNFLQVVSLLEDEDDINQITDYFSYEHFYVIYCKFWELDKDHDLYISKADLSRHNDSALSSRMIDRIFSGAVTRGSIRKDGMMSYSEFVWFLLSEEDKRHPRSIEYWFRCMDLDGDGFLSMYELEYFYSEQIKRMETVGIEALPFSDCLCQMLDLVRPQQNGRISLADLKRCRLTPIFFDTFFNLEKYLDHEQRDPFASSRDEDGLTMSDWDRYAAEEYELLVAEENAQQNNANLLDFTGENSGVNHFMIAANHFRLRARNSDDEDYDYDYVDSDSDYSY